MEGDWDFIIPLQKEDLQKKHEGQYYVKEVYELNAAIKKLKDLKTSFHKFGCKCLLEHFDTLYSIFCDKEISFLQLQDVYDTVIHQLVYSLKEFVENALTLEDPQSKKESVIVIKMVLYSFALFIRVYEDKLSHNAENFIAEPKRMKGGRTKPVKSVRPENIWDWSSLKKAAFVVIYQVLQVRISVLWPASVADEPFINMLANCCYKAYENPEIVQAKMKPLRDSISQVLSTLVMSYNHGMTFIPKIVQLLKQHEHVASAVCSTILVMVLEYNATTILPKLLRELSDTVRDEDVPGLAKSTAAVIIELAESDPVVLLPSINILLRNLIVEPYAVRNATLVAFCEIILKCLSDPKITEDNKLLRAKLLKYLHNHLRDQNSYVRSKVLQLWTKLAMEHAIPKDILIPVLQTAKNRLLDKSCFTVKNAIQFFTVILKENPWAGKLNQNEMHNQLVQAKLLLKTIDSKRSLSREETWKNLEGDLVLQLTNKITETEEEEHFTELPSTQNVGIQDVMIIITKLIQENHFIEAYSLLKQSEVQFPKAKEIRCNMDDTDMVEYYSAVLKKIFINAVDTSETLSLDFNNFSEEYEKQKLVVDYIEESIMFTQLINDVGKVIKDVLKGKSSIEVLEAIEFFTTAFQFGVADARKVIRSTLLLIKCKVPGVKEAVTAAYKTLYLVTNQPTPRGQAMHVAHRLIKLLKELDRSQKSALEELIEQWMTNKELNKEFIQVLWEKYSKKTTQTTEDESVASLILLDMMANSNLSLVASNISILIEVGLANPSSLMIVEYTCNMLSKYGLTQIDGKFLRLYSDNEIFEKGVKCLVDNFDQVPSKGYIPMSLAVINMIFKLCCYPEKLTDQILNDLYYKMFESNVEGINNGEDEGENNNHVGESFKETLLKRLLHIFSEIIFRKLQFYEKDVVNNLKKNIKIQEKNQEKKIDSDDSDEDDFCQRQDTEEAEAETVVQSAREMCEVVVMEKDNITSHLRDLTLKICKGVNEPVSLGLQCAAATALAKLMMVSQTFCEENIQLYVTLMAKAKEEVIRSNLVLGFGDMLWRFPNVIEPWTPHLYARLKDTETTVRKNTVVVLFHLITREMIKVRGQMAEVCLCLEDPEPSIAEQVQSLIIDLSQKGNTLYNIVPDIISRLSNPERPDPISSEVFNRIMKFVLGLIGKERQNELLVEKLCIRIKEANIERQWQDLAFCLSQLNYNEKSLRRLSDSIPVLNERLFCNEVRNAITSIILTANKAVNKPQLKEIASEIQSRLDEVFTYKDGEKEKDGDFESVLRTPRKAPPNTPRITRGTRSTAKSTKKTKR